MALQLLVNLLALFVTSYKVFDWTIFSYEKASTDPEYLHDLVKSVLNLGGYQHYYPFLITIYVASLFFILTLIILCHIWTKDWCMAYFDLSHAGLQVITLFIVIYLINAYHSNKIQVIILFTFILYHCFIVLAYGIAVVAKHLLVPEITFAESNFSLTYESTPEKTVFIENSTPPATPRNQSSRYIPSSEEAAPDTKLNQSVMNTSTPGKAPPSARHNQSVNREPTPTRATLNKQTQPETSETALGKGDVTKGKAFRRKSSIPENISSPTKLHDPTNDEEDERETADVTEDEEFPKNWSISENRSSPTKDHDPTNDEDEQEITKVDVHTAVGAFE